MGEVEWLTVLNGCREGTMYERFSERLREYFWSFRLQMRTFVNSARVSGGVPCELSRSD